MILFIVEKNLDVFTFEELLPNKKKYKSVYLKDFSFKIQIIYCSRKSLFFFR